MKYITGLEILLKSTSTSFMLNTCGGGVASVPQVMFHHFFPPKQCEETVSERRGREQEMGKSLRQKEQRNAQPQQYRGK